jgi:hypothetical protein
MRAKQLTASMKQCVWFTWVEKLSSTKLGYASDILPIAFLPLISCHVTWPQQPKLRIQPSLSAHFVDLCYTTSQHIYTSKKVKHTYGPTTLSNPKYAVGPFGRWETIKPSGWPRCSWTKIRSVISCDRQDSMISDITCISVKSEEQTLNH